jgi:hypothetical protein
LIWYTNASSSQPSTENISSKYTHPHQRIPSTSSTYTKATNNSPTTTIPLVFSNRPALPVELLISPIAPPVGITMPPDIVIPLFMLIISDCMALFIAEALDASAPEVVVGPSFHAIVTGPAEGVGMGIMEVIDPDEVARAAGAKPKTMLETMEKRIMYV